MVQILQCSAQSSVWVFIAEMDEGVERPRFLFDIRNFAEKLKIKQSGDDTNFYFFVDNVNQLKSVLELANISTNKIYHISQFEIEVGKLSGIPFLGCVVSSHGNINGAATLKPNKILTCINNIPGLTDGLLLLGQCFAGVFNVPTTSKICVIGASNFCESLSAKFSEVSWCANIFLYYFSRWFIENNNQDVDGDGNCSILDAYKYASFHTSLLLQNIKAGFSKSFHIWCTDEFKKLQDISNQIIAPKEDQNIVELQAVYKSTQLELDRNLSLYHNNQEPWISDMSVAMRLII